MLWTNFLTRIITILFSSVWEILKLSLLTIGILWTPSFAGRLDLGYQKRLAFMLTWSSDAPTSRRYIGLLPWEMSHNTNFRTRRVRCWSQELAAERSHVRRLCNKAKRSLQITVNPLGRQNGVSWQTSCSSRGHNKTAGERIDLLLGARLLGCISRYDLTSTWIPLWP